MFDVNSWPPDRVDPDEVNAHTSAAMKMALTIAIVIGIVVAIGGNMLFGGSSSSDNPTPAVPTTTPFIKPLPATAPPIFDRCAKLSINDFKTYLEYSDAKEACRR